jgi:hypothetical protein
MSMHARRLAGPAAIAAAVVALALPTAASAGVHATTTTYPVGDGTSPSQIATGDFDGDGRMDLVTAGVGAGGSDFSILRGLGGGTFATAAIFDASPRPEGVAVADFDENGVSDIVLPADAPPGSVTILLSNVDGLFDATDIGFADPATAVATGDFDDDTHSDVAVATPGNVWVILGGGDGTFGGPLGPFPTGGGGSGRIATGDFDGNGRDDIVATPGAPVGSASSIATMLSNADGTLAAAVPTAVTAVPLDPRGADFDGDGRSDVVVTYASVDAVGVLRGAAGGTLGAPLDLAASRGTAAVADANHDGAQDIAVAGTSGAVSIFLGRGDGTFLPRAALSAPGSFSTALGADLDSDGFGDLALGHLTPGAVVVARNAPSAVPSAASLTFAGTRVGAAAPAQTVSLTNDGLPPLAISGASLGGADPRDFRVLADGCSGRAIPGGATCAVTVAMAPTATGARSADLALASTSAEGTVHVALAGAGLGAGGGGARVPPDVSAPVVGLTVRARRLRVVLRRGLRVTLSCSEACTADARLVLSRTLARRFHLPARAPLVVARRTVRLAKAGRTTVTLRLTRRAVRALRNVRRLTLTLRVSARDAAGNARVRTRPVTLRR